MVIVVFAVLAFMGVASYMRLPIELVPKFSAPVVTIITIYPGASPSEVENAVSKPIEDAISSLEGIDQIQVGSQENSSFIAVEFEQSVDLDKAVQELQRKINQLQAGLPKEVRPPVINKFAFDELPILKIGVAGNLTGPAFYDVIKNRVVPEISQVKGVAQVSILGGEEREIKINISSARLEQYGLSLLQVIEKAKASGDKGLFNNSAQIWNHTFFWNCLAPAGSTKPSGKLASLIDNFGGQDALLKALAAEGVGHFGSGWAWLVLESDALKITSYHDADTPVAHGATPLLTLDVWEHAYYIDYRNARPKFAETVLANIVNWDFVAQNLDGKGASRADQKQ